jgi:hypothetical protein
LITRSGAPSGNFFPIGTTTITHTATDAVATQRPPLRPSR